MSGLDPKDVFLAQYELPGSSEWPEEEREAALKSIDRAVKHQIQQIEHDRAEGTDHAEAIFCDHTRWREAEEEVEKLRGQRDQWKWLYHQLHRAIRRHRDRIVPSRSDREQRDADEALWALLGEEVPGV